MRLPHYLINRSPCLLNFRSLSLFGMLLLVQGIPALAQSSRETIEAISPKIVKIYGAGGIQRLHSYSTGFLISPEGHIATVWSHVLDTDSVGVVLHNGKKFEAKLLGAESQVDLAILKIEGKDLPYFDLETETHESDPGTRVLGFSNMFKVASGDEPVSLLHGVIAAKTKLTARRGVFEIPYNGPVYIVDAITNNPGGAGGVVTTVDGKLLAIIGKEVRNAQSNTWVNYAIPIKEIKPAVKEIITGKYVPRKEELTENSTDAAKRYRPLDFGVATVPDVLYRTPAFIDLVIPGSTAEKAGLLPDDLILFVNDQLIQSVKMLEEELGKAEKGDVLHLVVRRGNTLISADIPVPSKEEE